MKTVFIVVLSQWVKHPMRDLNRKTLFTLPLSAFNAKEDAKSWIEACSREMYPSAETWEWTSTEAHESYYHAETRPFAEEWQGMVYDLHEIPVR